MALNLNCNLYCHFQCTNGELPIDALDMAPPQIGSLIFFEGEDDGYRVVDVQYQLRRLTKEKPKHLLILVNVLLERIPDRTWTPPNTSRRR